MPAAHELEQRIAPQGIGVVLIFVTTGDLQQALAQQERKRMAHRTAAPVADMGGKAGRQTQVVVGLREPDEAAIRGELPGVKGHPESGGERGHARIRHRRASWSWSVDEATRPYPRGSTLSSGR